MNLKRINTNLKQATYKLGPIAGSLSVRRLTAIANEVHSPFLWSVKTMTPVVVLVPVAGGGGGKISF
jgi:hypothetical protein